MMRSSIRAKLLAAFALDLLLMVSLGWFAAQQMSLMNERATFVEQQTIPTLNTIAGITTVINSYRVSQLEYLIYSNPYDKDRSKQKMSAIEGEMSGYFSAYQGLISSPSERTRFDNVMATWQQVVDTNHSSFIPAVGLVNTGSVQPFYSRMNPLYDRLDLAVKELAAEGQAQATTALEDVRATYGRARAVIMGDTLLTTVISAVIGLMLSGRIALRIGRLTGATARVAAGDLDRKVDIVSRDELGVLAQSFNQMVDSLREQRQALEQRNQELRASLRRQEQLTDDLRRGKQAEEEAQRGQAAAEAASRAKSMFLANMSHELRTPLNAILGYAQLLRLNALQSRADGETIAQLDRIVVAGRHLTTVISNVINFSKIEQGKIDLDIGQVDICALARESADIVEPLMDQHGNRLRIDCPIDIGTIETDGPKLRQVLCNLLSNAAKFTEGGEIVLSIERVVPDQPEPSLAAQPAALVFSVRDTGIGIAADQLGKLFQPFSQVDSSVTRRFEGSGLGLALSRQICLALGGDITVESVLGQGSIFRIALPTSSTLSLIGAELAN